MIRKILWAAFLVVAWVSFSFGQGSAQLAAASASPRKADAQFHADYARAKRINARISDATARAAAKLERGTREDRLTLEGLTDELQAEMRKACADVPQGCHYDETLDAFIPNAGAAKPTEEKK